MLYTLATTFFVIQALLMAFIVYDGRVNARRLHQVTALRARIAELEKRTI